MREYVIKLLDILNKENNTSFKLKDFRGIVRFMNKRTRAEFKKSAGFSIRSENILGLILTHKDNRNLNGLVETELHEYYHLMGKNDTKSEEYAKKNRDKYVGLLKAV